ncbi:Rhomboid family protein [Syntrophobotulus glycolicus DSM 8271]|uniref:Rhomboid family protein n=1 Tax=Syntrophobotulus glycolicus (strain DSM 8271 / FlGlyR) TaxID=645991 RepID=F0SZJ7_SYNGF|nr:rhomboid family intramembrane serine protease [Syntrophobotulus glycolicus]ADY56083.1 Rhomboid family protein [Syntrophobotulus glycolicus DSM 8271]
MINKNRTKSIVTNTFLIMNILVFLVMTLAGGTTNQVVLVIFGAKVNQLIDLGQYWRLLTSIFIHIGIVHLLLNSYALIAVGQISEAVFGHLKFALLYLLSGIGGATASYLFSEAISAGASGAIFGLLGALVSYGWKNAGMWRSGLIANLLFVIGFNILFGLITTGIDNYAHIGGMLTGLIIGIIYRQQR